MTILSIQNDWTHIDNADFYEHYLPDAVSTHAELGGLANHSDLKQIENYLKSSQNILELGAGTGRVLDFLLKNNYGNCLTAIERSSQFFNLLKEKYSTQVNLFNEDIFDFYTSKKFDLILWMFSGISDFAKHEQLLVLEKYVKFLTPNGKLIIETFAASNSPLNASEYANQTYTASLEQHLLHGYIPNCEEIQNYARMIKCVCRQIEYKTETSRTRYINVFALD